MLRTLILTDVTIDYDKYEESRATGEADRVRSNSQAVGHSGKSGKPRLLLSVRERRRSKITSCQVEAVRSSKATRVGLSQQTMRQLRSQMPRDASLAVAPHRALYIPYRLIIYMLTICALLTTWFSHAILELRFDPAQASFQLISQL